MKNWFTHGAQWYEFWYPQSGLVGGLIFASLILTPMALIVSLC